MTTVKFLVKIRDVKVRWISAKLIYIYFYKKYFTLLSPAKVGLPLRITVNIFFKNDNCLPTRSAINLAFLRVIGRIIVV